MMASNHRRILATATALLCLAQPVWACSTFFLLRNGCSIFGRNYDWVVEDGFVMVNKRGVKKSALVVDRPATWTSKYGSVTFNQYGRDFPIGGMNEAGLVVENMWLDEARYPDADDRNAVNCLQWIQYQLDMCATVDEVIATDQQIRITNAEVATLHYLVADKSGHSAVIEFLDGKMTYHRNGESDPVALTNDTYHSSVRYLKGFDGFGGDMPIRTTTSSLDRFVRSLAGAQQCSPADASEAVDQAFAILHDVAQGDFTKWSIVYDVAHGKIHFRTRSANRRRVVDTKKFNYSCKKPVLVLDMSADLTGDVTERFVPYTQELNRELVRSACAKTPFLKNIPSVMLELHATYPSTTTCIPPSSERRPETPASNSSSDRSERHLETSPTTRNSTSPR